MSEFSHCAFPFWLNHSGLVWKKKFPSYGVTLCFVKKTSLLVSAGGLWLEAFVVVLVSVKKQLIKVMLKQYMDLEARLRCFESRGYPCE